MKMRKAFTLPELLTATVIAALMVVTAIGAFIIVKDVTNYSAAEFAIQRDINGLMARVIRNIKEGVESYGLRPGRSFNITAADRLEYAGADGNTRRYYLEGPSIIYENPAQWPQRKAIFTVPAGFSITLRFWEPTGYLDNETVGIYVGARSVVGGKALSGSAATYINLRNIAK